MIFKRRTHATISSLLTALNDSWPDELVSPFRRPTPSRKLRACCRAAGSGMIDSACRAVISYWKRHQWWGKMKFWIHTFLDEARAAWCKRLSCSLGGRLLIESATFDYLFSWWSVTEPIQCSVQRLKTQKVTAASHVIINSQTRRLPFYQYLWSVL